MKVTGKEGSIERQQHFQTLAYLGWLRMQSCMIRSGNLGGNTGASTFEYKV